MKKLIYSTPYLKSKKDLTIDTETGNLKYWQGLVYRDECTNDIYIGSQHYQDTKEGSSKIQQSALTKVQSKNVGKSNQTSLFDQAISQITSEMNKKIDKGYIERNHSFAEIEFLPLPMLAKEYKDRLKYIIFPCYVQPKYDGIRVLFDGQKMWSRLGKTIIPKCISHLLGEKQDYILDGELILPQPYTFQDTLSAIKKFDSEISPKLIFRAYDLIDTKKIYSERYEILKEVCSRFPLYELTPIQVVNSFQEIEDCHDALVEQGWEGAIIRLNQKPYQIRKRSSDLLKLKAWDEQDFEVIAVTEGEGKFEGQVILEFIDENTGLTFTATPKATEATKRELFLNKESLIGTLWKVKYFGFCLDKEGNATVPRFPIALSQRDEFLEG